MATDKTNLQVMITNELEKKVKQKAIKLGFNNVPEMVRSMLVSITNETISLSPFNYLSPKQEDIYDKEIARAKSEYSTGKSKSYTNVDEMINAIES
jgi:hypothetical protein